MNLLDLFSGIGGFSLGLERAGFKTVAFCELDPWCQRVLAKHWPKVPIYDDVRNLNAAGLRADGIGRIDAICGGFPCQDISLAGKGAGLDGERSGLWREFARLVGELRPCYAIVENVGAIRGRGLAAVLGDLAALRYDAEWHVIPAAAVGAPHLRERVWIVAADADAGARGLRADGVAPGSGGPGRVAYADKRGSGGPAADAASLWQGQQRERAGADPAGHRSATGNGAARRTCEGSSQGHPAGADEGPACSAADADGGRLQCERVARHRDEQGAPWHQPDGLGARGWRDGPAAADTASAGPSQLRGLQRRLARALAAASAPWQRTSEPPLRRVDDGLPAGLDGPARARHARLIRSQDRERTKALGNSVVPLIPEIIGRALLKVP